jgi:hypothetical protein
MEFLYNVCFNIEQVYIKPYWISLESMTGTPIETLRINTIKELKSRFPKKRFFFEGRILQSLKKIPRFPMNPNIVTSTKKEYKYWVVLNFKYKNTHKFKFNTLKELKKYTRNIDPHARYKPCLYYNGRVILSVNELTPFPSKPDTITVGYY